MYGRGYTKNGLQKAASFLEKECKKNNALPIFNNCYCQSFKHPVIKFKGSTKVILNNKRLVPGQDYIIDPHSPSIKGSFTLEKIDSVSFLDIETKKSVLVQPVNKLTFSVGTKLNKYAGIKILKSSIEGEPRTISLHIQTELDSIFESLNIGCKIEGAIKDSFIVYTAHYDHLGSMGKNVFFPGANDNASGTSMLLNIMKHYAKIKPKYSIVFVFFAAEEAGLLGSKFFVENSPIDLTKIKFLINLDLMGTGDDGVMVVNGAIFNEQFNRIELINKERQYLAAIKKRGKAMNSDHYWFTEKGVPSFFLYTLGGIKAYHDIYDIEKTLPLTKYKEVFHLLVDFTNSF